MSNLNLRLSQRPQDIPVEPPASERAEERKVMMKPEPRKDPAPLTLTPYGK